MTELLFPGEPVPLTAARREELVERRLQSLADKLARAMPPYAQGLVQPVAGTIGYQELIVGATPAAGSSYRYRVPGEEVIRPLSVLCRLTTSAAAGQRSLTLEYQDTEDVRYLVAGAPVTLAPSQTQSFCWHPLAGDVTWPVEDAALAPLPQQMIYPTHSLVLKVGGVQAGDQLDQVRLSVEKFQTGQA